MRIHQRCFGWRLVAVRLCTRRVRNSHAVGYTTDVPSSPSSQPQPSPSEFGSAGGEVSKHKKCAGAEARRKTQIFCGLRVGYEFHFADILPTPSPRRPDVGHIPTHHKPHTTHCTQGCLSFWQDPLVPSTKQRYEYASRDDFLFLVCVSGK